MNPETEIPVVLYKYRDLSGGNREYVRQTIVNNRVWFSSPADFNDPFDCRAHMSFRGSKKDWQKYLFGLFKKYAPHLNRVQRQAEIARVFRTEKRHKNPEVFRNVLADAQRDINGLGVFCLSTCNDDILMWSYYANRHTGVCLGFAHQVGLLGAAYPVEYASEFPEVDYLSDGDMRKLKANILTKASAWSHEREWRVIDRVRGPGVRQFSPEVLVAVIFGARMSQEDRKEIISWIEARRNKPQLYEACLKDRVYGLEVRPFDQQWRDERQHKPARSACR
jgi:hypothetical protein